MNVAIKNILFGVILLSLLGFALWTTLIILMPDKKIKRDYSLIPDGYMENVTALILDRNGNPNMKIKTPRLIHFSKNDISELDFPEISLYRGSPTPWLITSTHATAYKGNDNILFIDNVTILHTDPDQPQTEIKTNTLNVFPNREVAETKDEITMTQPNTVIKGRGLFADLSKGDINLLSKTQAEYVPN